MKHSQIRPLWNGNAQAGFRRTCGLPDKKAAEKFVNALKSLCLKCEVPSLLKYGINRKIFFDSMDKMADDALKSGSPANTIKKVTKEDILSIYASLWD